MSREHGGGANRWLDGRPGEARATPGRMDVRCRQERASAVIVGTRPRLEYPQRVAPSRPAQRDADLRAVWRRSLTAAAASAVMAANAGPTALVSDSNVASHGASAARVMS